MNRNFIIKCPYCPNKFKIKLYADDTIPIREVVLCPSDESENNYGGCDRWFVLEYKASIDITEVYKMVETGPVGRAEY